MGFLIVNFYLSLRLVRLVTDSCQTIIVTGLRCPKIGMWYLVCTCDVCGVSLGADPLKVGQLNFVYLLSKEAGDIA